MSLSSRQIGKILGEIEIPLNGGVLRRIDQSQRDRIRLEIHNRGKRYRFLIAANPNHARCHLVTKKDPSPATPPQFCQLLRSHLRYKRLIAIEQLHEDRVVQLRFGWNGEVADRILLAELTGVGSNLFLLDGKGFVVGSLFSPRKNRPLSPGKRYVSLSFNKQASYKETVIPTGTAGVPFQFNLDVEDYYAELEKKERREKEKKALISTMKAAIKKKHQQLKRRLDELAIAEKSEHAREFGEILKNHLYQVTPGADQFSCANERDPSKEDIIIPLDPALSPSENMARYFKKYKKASSAQTNLKIIIIKTREQLTLLEDDLETASKVDILTDDPLPSSFPSIPTKKKPPKDAKKSPSAYLSHDDMMMIIGRNDRENEEVTFRMARGNDYWFHARGVPGAHLLLRMMRKKEIPYQTLLDAATLALYFSQHKKSGRGEILYTYKKYVQRVKKGRPGSVICSQEKTLYLELDETRLSRILESRVFK